MDGEATPPRLLSGVIVGREAVLDRLRRLLDASSAEGRAVAIVGEAGLGKTRLAKALVSAARERARVVLVGRASPLEAALPLAVLQDALREERRGPAEIPVPADPLAAAFPGLLLPELASAERAGSTMDRGALLEAAARYFRARASPAGLVLVLEDLHWADPTTHTLVGYLARATQNAPILLVLTFRADEASPGSSLAGLRHELARERLSEELDLEPLAQGDVALMLSDILGTDVSRDVAAMVFGASGGNPFVIEELVRDAVASGTLDAVRGSWELSEPIVLPGTVQEMLVRRIRTLQESDGELVKWAAVLGERFDADLLAAAAGWGEGVALEALGRLREAGLVADTRDLADGRLAFRHALTRQAVLAGMLAPERRRRHARVLEVAAPPGGISELPLGERLEHALGSGDRARVLRYSVEAGGRAVGLGGYAEARGHYERALSLWASEDGAPMRADLLMRLGYLTSHIGGGFLLWMAQHQSRQYFDEARALFDQLGDEHSAALAAGGSVWSRRRIDVVDDLRGALGRLSGAGAPDAVCQILCRLGDREFLVGHSRAALRTCSEGLALLEASPEANDPAQFPRRVQLRRSLQLTEAAATWWLGDADRGRATMLSLVDDALAENDYLMAALTLNYLTRQSFDRPAEAAAFARRGTELAEQHGLSSTVAWLCHLTAQAQLQLGRPVEAEEALERAEALLVGEHDHPFVRDAVRMVRAELALVAGQIDEAVANLAPLAAELDARHGRIFRRTVRVALARAHLTREEPQAAADALAPVLAAWNSAEEGPYALSALLPMACAEVASALGDGDGAAGWGSELASLGGGPRARYAGALAGLARGAVGCCGIVEEACQGVEKDGRRWEGAWMRFAGARAAVAAGDESGAAALALAAIAAFHDMGGGGWHRTCEVLLRRLGCRVPVRRAARGAGGLTPREVEVLRLIVDGCSNRAIAERLVISEGTAGRHVSNVYAKLGAHSRLEAARIASERGLLADASQ
ncbi:MAG TPA: AAA family ATPase [Miltoncostaeaceae bacterium]|nr:AAA family ATPase [Miltoncostaeaceae bacterium]